MRSVSNNLGEMYTVATAAMSEAGSPALFSVPEVWGQV